MKNIKKIIALVVTTVMLVAMCPAQIFAADVSGDYSIANEYVMYTINSKTGGFSIDTLEGHPQKKFDNNMPLLYKDASGNSNGTSFATIRIGDKDYIFGQDYGWFKIDSKLYEPVVSNDGHLITVQWDIKGYSVVQKVALSIDENNNLCGNVGISYEITNNTNEVNDVGVRVLLDNALDTKTDAPYVMAGMGISPSIVEEEFSNAKNNLPQQVRYMDSLSNTSKMAYAILAGWSGTSDAVADRVIVGHWANMANTRFDYTPNASCDFSNYSNEYKTPDTATSFYWSPRPLGTGEKRTSEVLYGIGNFSAELTQKHLGLDVISEGVKLDANGTEYEKAGKFNVTVNIDNSVDGARVLVSPVVKLTLDDGLLFEKTGTKEFSVTYTGGIDIGSIKTIDVVVIAEKQAMITSKRVAVSVTGSEYIDADNNKLVEYNSSRNVLLPAVGGLLPDIQMTQVSPEIVYISGEKNVTISGKMTAFKALPGSKGWDMYVVSQADGKEYLIDKTNIAFTDESFESISFAFDSEIAIGTYDIVFKFTDEQLKNAFGDSLTATVNLTASNDPKYRCKSYGIVAMTRFGSNEYDLLSFANEGELESFTSGKKKANGLTHTNVSFTDSSEILITVRGKIRQMQADDGSKYYQANPADGDVTLNNIMAYTSETPLDMRSDGTDTEINGDGTIKVINSINIWHNKWQFATQRGIKYTLNMDDVNDTNCSSIDLKFVGAGSMLQQISGFLIDLKFGQLTRDDDLYGISFGGKITVPIGGGSKDDDGGGAGGGTAGPPTTGEAGEEEGGDGAAIRAEITDIMYGGSMNAETGLAETGFIGIDTTLGVKLPEGVLGSLVSNVGGLEASLQINTIDNVYKLEMGVDLAIISCEGVIAFKQVPIKGIERIVPDELGFRLAGFAQVPIVPPYVFMTGIGGGISDLADSMSDKLTELPPITLHLYTQLALIETLKGDFNLAINLSGMELTGELKMTGDSDGKVLKIEGGLSARWIDPFFINAYGRVSIIDGLVKGGISISISSDSFYGYVYASVNIPDSVPVFGGMQLAGVEASVSDDFIGANLLVIGLKFGFIYYWDGNFKFGSGIDLSAKGGAVTEIASYYYDEDGKRVDYVGLYGTNMKRLSSTLVGTSKADGGSIIKNFDPSTEDALLLEIPFTGIGTPTIDEIILKDPNGKKIELVANDNKGNGNLIIQDLGNGKRYIYISIVDKSQLIKGDWSVGITSKDVEITNFNVDGVNNIPEMASTSFTHESETSKKLTVNWTTDSVGKAPGAVDIYLTKNANALEDIKSANTSQDKALSDIVSHIELDSAASGSKEIDIPDSYADGDYYVVTTLSQSEGGMSTAISAKPFKFVNDKLPKSIKSASLSYAGNGGLKLDVVDNDVIDYTNYAVTLVDDNANEVKDGYSIHKVGDYMVLGEALNLEAGRKYTAKITTYNEVNGISYFGSTSVATEPFVMPKVSKPKLLLVDANLSGNNKYAKTNEFKAKYKFDTPVAFYSVIDGVETRIGEGYKQEWEINKVLEDGDHIINFKAVNEQKDKVTGEDFVATNSNAIFAYNVDTMAPVLSFEENISESVEADKPLTQFSAQNVFMNSDGTIQLKGIAEAEATVLFDGTNEGITLNKDGSFVINRQMDKTAVYKQCELSAVDKAGNKTVVMVNVVNSSLAAFESLQIYADATTELDKNGVKYIELDVGNIANLKAFGVKNGAGEVAIDKNKISWNVLYEKNIISINDGVITALAPGETSIRASYDTIVFDSAETGELTGSVSDVIVVVVKDSGYRYSLTKTQNYTLFAYKTQGDVGDITVTIDGKQTHLLYDAKSSSYVGAFVGDVSSDNIMKSMKTDAGAKSAKMIYGDINDDGAVNDADSNIAIESFLYGMSSLSNDANAVVRGDVNGDGIVDIIDAQLMIIKKLSKGN